MSLKQKSLHWKNMFVNRLQRYVNAGCIANRSGANNYNLEGNLYQTADETVLVFRDIHSKCFKTIYIVMRFQHNATISQTSCCAAAFTFKKKHCLGVLTYS